MKRREFITLIAGATLVSPFGLKAQTPKQVKRLGILMNGVEANQTAQSYLATFTGKLGELGWEDGKNLHIEYRWNAGEPALARAYATELIGLRLDVILASSTMNLTAAQRVNQTIPIVFVEVSDPLAQGFVTNLAHPGGNITGFTSFTVSMGGQWVDLLKQVAPNVKRILIVFNPETSPQSKTFLQSVGAAAGQFSVEIIGVAVRDSDDIETAIRDFAHLPDSGLIVPSDTYTQMRRGLIVALAARYRLPAVYTSPDFVRNGGLMYYGFDFVEQFRKAAPYVDRILRGTMPGDLPIQQPIKLALIVNLVTAKALGLTVPPSLLKRADEVIE